MERSWRNQSLERGESEMDDNLVYRIKNDFFIIFIRVSENHQDSASGKGPDIEG